MCGSCHEKITREQLSSNWDWSGPHCPHCGHGGFSMFVDIVEQETGKGIQAR